MVVFYDTTCQRETEAPAAFLCREAGGEDAIVVALGDSFACVFYVNVDTLGCLGDMDADASLAIHGVDGILAEVLDDPL